MPMSKKKLMAKMLVGDSSTLLDFFHNNFGKLQFFLKYIIYWSNLFPLSFLRSIIS